MNIESVVLSYYTFIFCVLEVKMITKDKIRELLIVIHDNNIKGLGINRHNIYPMDDKTMNFEVDGKVYCLDDAINKVYENR